MNTINDLSTNPFVGATPYEERHHSRFFGREKEIGELIQNMVLWQLNVLAGESAAGKTSLLRAGLIPELGKRRNASLENSSEKIIYPFPVLVFRDWGGVANSADLRTYLWMSLAEAIERLNPEKTPEEADFKNHNDYQIASGILEKAQLIDEARSRAQNELFVASVMSLVRQYGGVILIFDQLEELFRSRLQESNEIIELIKDLYYLNKQVRILISLREEYLHALRFLDHEVGSIMRRAYFLKAIPSTDQNGVTKQVGLIIEKSFESEDIFLDRDTRDRLILNCSMVKKGIEEKLDFRSNNLLTLQVVSYEFFSYLKKQGKKRVLIEDLLGYEQSVIIDSQEEEDYLFVYSEALERWITMSLNDFNSDSDHTEMSCRVGYIRWIAARISSFLSAGDYKISIRTKELLDKLIENEEINTRKLMNKYGIYEDAQSAIESYFNDTISVLKNANILKTYNDNSEDSLGKRVELVHDLLGSALSNWASKIFGTLEDSISSPVENVGVDVMLQSGSVDLSSSYFQPAKFYQGCSFITDIGNVDLKSLQNLSEFSGIDFSGWTFKGTIFKGISFDNCTFRNVDLQGVLFWCCVFKDSDFIDIAKEKSQVDFRGCRFENVTFDGETTLCQVSFYYDSEVGRPTELVKQKHDKSDKAAIAFGKSNNITVQLARLEQLVSIDGCVISANKETKFEYCMWDQSSAKLLNASAHQIISCGSQTKSEQ